ncbi:MAG: ArsR/SmtB family transcription factor [Bacilli bacterium]
MANKKSKVPQKEMNLSLLNVQQVEDVANALSSTTRLKIISLLVDNSYTICEIARLLNVSVSTASFHIKLLKNARIVNLTRNPSKKGNEKIVALEKNKISILIDYPLNDRAIKNNSSYFTEIPIGSYSSFKVKGPCGIADTNGQLIGLESQPEIFYDFRTINAGIIWFLQGYLSYTIPNMAFKNRPIESIEISFEACSECANYNNNFKSDISIYLNDKKVGVYVSPGDFGGRRGKYTPESWSLASTQYGKMVQIRIDAKGTYINQEISSNYTIEDFQDISTADCMNLKISIDKDSKYIGGINLFGKNFGDYNQDIRINIIYKK